jgi:hypothetical protein
MKKHPDQERLEQALRASWESPVDILQFRYVLGCYRDALEAQAAGFKVDWSTTAQSLIPLLESNP